MISVQKDRQVAEYGDDEIVERFLISYKDRSPYTLRNYRQAISRFRAFLAPILLNQANWQHIEGFKHALLEGQLGKGPQSLSSVAIQMVSVRSLYRWGNDPNIHLLVQNPTTCIRIPKIQIDSKRRFLTKRELSLLLVALKRQSQRNYVIGLMLVMLGLRVSELISVRWVDFYWDVTETTLWLSIRNGKGRKSREVKVPSTLWSAIQSLKRKHTQTKPSSLQSFQLFPISTRQVERIIRGAGISCCLQKSVTPHWLRHTNATMALLNGASLQQVQESLGHSEIATTQRYLHTVEQLKKAPSDYVEDGIKDLLF